jgi:hypothetical protein
MTTTQTPGRPGCPQAQMPDQASPALVRFCQEVMAGA